MPSETKVPILILAMSLEIGGAETAVVSLAKHLKMRGWDVTVASAGGALVAALDTAGVPHVVAPLDSRSPLKMAKAALTIRKLVKSKGIGLIHAHARIPAWISEGIARRAGIPMVVTYHGTFAAGVFWNFFTRPGDKTIAVSEDIKRYAVEKYGFDAAGIYVIPNGIDLDVFHLASPEERKASRESFGLTADRSPVIAYVSRLEDDLTEVARTAIRSVTLLQEKYPDIALLVAGDGDDAQVVAQACEHANAGTGRDTVRYLGYVKDPFRAYAAADIVVGMSRVALEASASGTPVIIAGGGGLFGPISPETAAQLEERNFTTRGAPNPLHTEALSEELERLIENEETRRDLAAFARGLVVSKHSMEHVTAETEKIYYLAMDRRNPIPS